MFPFFSAALPEKKWQPLREGFDFLYYIDNNVGGPTGQSLSDLHADQPGLSHPENEAEEERYDTVGDADLEEEKQSMQDEDEKDDEERKPEHDEF